MRRCLISCVMLILMLGALLTVAPAAAWADQTATPAATRGGSEPTTETLLEAPIDALPAGHSIVAVDRWRMQPSETALTMPALGGVVMITVEAGELTAAVAGSEQSLGPGHTFTAPADAEVAFRLTGSDEATLFVVYVVKGFADIGFWESDPIAHRADFLISTSTDALPEGATRLVLERVTLPPGSALPPQAAAPLVWTEVGEGALGLTLDGEGLPFRWDAGEERTFRPGQYLPPVRPGTTMTMRNAGDAPLVLYRLTLTPHGDDASTAGTPMGSTPVP